MLTARVIKLLTHGPMKPFDLTDELKKEAKKVKKGLILVHVEGATPGLILTSFSREDVWNLCSEIIPVDADYEHGNAYAHLRSSFMSTSVEIPVVEGEPLIGQRRLYLVEIEPRRRMRKVIFVTVGEGSDRAST